MNYTSYDVPSSLLELFQHGERSYRIINYEPNMEMDNNQSMVHFVETVGIHSDNIETDEGTQLVLKHPDFGFKLVVDAGGLGDFYSHGFDVSIHHD